MFPRSGLLRWLLGVMANDEVDPNQRLLEIIAYQASQLEISRENAPQQLRLTEEEIDVNGKLVTYKILTFIHYGSRHIWIAGYTQHPNAQWVDWQTKRFIKHTKKINIPCTELIADNDPVFTGTMADILEEADINLIHILAGVPKMNAYIERINRTLQEECLNHFILFSEEHMVSLLREFQDYYNQFRPHRAFDLNPLTFENRGPEKPSLTKAPENIKTIQFLGGLHTHFYVDGEPKIAA